MYNFIDSELIVGIDIDNTLVTWDNASTPGPGKTEFDYYGTPVFLTLHNYHIAIVKSYFARGYFNRAWSANGRLWCKQVIDKVGLAEFVHEVGSKPVKCLDDTKDSANITGPLIWEPDLLKK